MFHAGLPSLLLPPSVDLTWVLLCPCPRDGTYNCLIATDVAGRGIDVPDVALVVNYDMPGSIENYTHRIGRTGRAGRKGIAVTFLTLGDTGACGHGPAGGLQELEPQHCKCGSAQHWRRAAFLLAVEVVLCCGIAGVFFDLKKLLEESRAAVPPELARHEAAKVKPGSIEQKSRKDQTVFAA
jgi:ATP-dependent RNA helicase DDX23/PRP28